MQQHEAQRQLDHRLCWGSAGRGAEVPFLPTRRRKLTNEVTWDHHSSTTSTLVWRQKGRAIQRDRRGGLPMSPLRRYPGGDTHAGWPPLRPCGEARSVRQSLWRPSS